MNRRDVITLGPEEQREFLTHAKTIILASNDPHGYPHLVPMWFVVDDDGTVVMTTYAKSQKVANLLRDPRCALLVESGTSYSELKGVLIRGRATIDGEYGDAGSSSTSRPSCVSLLTADSRLSLSKIVDRRAFPADKI